MHPTPAQHGKSTTVQGSENHILLLCPAFLGVGWLSLSLRGGSSVCTGVVLKTPAHPCLEVEAGSQPGPRRGSQPKQLEAFTWPGFLRAWHLGSRGEHPSRNGQSLSPVVTQPQKSRSILLRLSQACQTSRGLSTDPAAQRDQ